MSTSVADSTRQLKAIKITADAYRLVSHEAAEWECDKCEVISVAVHHFATLNPTRREKLVRDYQAKKRAA